MPNSTCCVLCVDDHHDTSEMLQMLLSEENYEVHTAATMEEACKWPPKNAVRSLRARQASAGRHGRRVVRDLMTITPAVPCIFYTGDAYEIHRREAFAAGAAAFVAKPDIEGLINAVHNYWRKASAPLRLNNLSRTSLA